MFTTRTIAAIATAATLTIAGLSGAQATERHYGGYGGNYGASAARLALINGRISNQVRRITSGRQAGRINWFEARRLHAGLGRIRRVRNAFMYDRRLSHGEKAKLHGMLNDNSARIRRLAHNSYGDRRDGRSGDRYRNPYGNRRLSHLNGFRY